MLVNFCKMSQFVLPPYENRNLEKLSPMAARKEPASLIADALARQKKRCIKAVNNYAEATEAIAFINGAGQVQSPIAGLPVRATDVLNSLWRNVYMEILQLVSLTGSWSDPHRYLAYPEIYSDAQYVALSWTDREVTFSGILKPIPVTTDQEEPILIHVLENSQVPALHPLSGNASFSGIARVVWFACFFHLHRTLIPSVAPVYDVVAANAPIQVAKAGQPVPITAAIAAIISERPNVDLYDFVSCVLLDVVIEPIRKIDHPFAESVHQHDLPAWQERTNAEKTDLIWRQLLEALNTLDRLHKGSLVINDVRLSNFGACTVRSSRRHVDDAEARRSRVCLTRFDDACFSEKANPRDADWFAGAKDNTNRLFRTKLSIAPSEVMQRIGELNSQHGVRILTESINLIWTEIHTIPDKGELGVHSKMISRVRDIFVRVGICKEGAVIESVEPSISDSPIVFWAPSDFDVRVLAPMSRGFMPRHRDGTTFKLVFALPGKRRILTCSNVTNNRVDFAILLLDIAEVLIGGKGPAAVARPWLAVSDKEQFRRDLFSNLLKTKELNWHLFW